MSKFSDNIDGLRRYLKLGVDNKSLLKSRLLSSNEALKAFGEVGLEHKEDIMMMLAVLEYEYGRNHSYTEREMVGVKRVLGSVAKFMFECGKEWEEYKLKNK